MGELEDNQEEAKEVEEAGKKKTCACLVIIQSVLKIIKKLLNCINDFINKYNNFIVIVLLVVGIGVAWFQLSRNTRETKYRYLTGVWNDIMKESIKHPEFNDKSKTQEYSKAFHGDQKRAYESYARWIGGFVEDLYVNDYKKEKWLYYEPWIESTLDIHSTWFVDHIHYYVHTVELKKRLLEIKNEKSNDTLEATGSDSPKPQG
jgi:hypothetical protein